MDVAEEPWRSDRTKRTRIDASRERVQFGSSGERRSNESEIKLTRKVAVLDESGEMGVGVI